MIPRDSTALSTRSAPESGSPILPAPTVNNQPELPLTPNQSQPVPGMQRRRSSGIKIQKPRILLIDDDPDMRELFANVLERNMYEVVQAIDGLDGLQKVYDSSPDLVLCDLMMPTMSGRDFLLHMREHPDTKEIPIIIFTAADDEETETGLLDLGATDFVSKGSSSSVMLSRVRRMLALYSS